MNHCIIEAYLGPAGLDLHFSCPPTRCDWRKELIGKRCYWYNRHLSECQCAGSQESATKALYAAIAPKNKEESHD